MEEKTTSIIRIYISTTDKIGSEALYEHIIYKAKEWGLAGATAIRGLMGYGSSASVQSFKFWELGEKLPIIVEIIDEKDKIEQLLPAFFEILERSGKGFMVTSQDLGVKMIRKGQK